MSIRILGKRILLKTPENKVKTKAGVVIPEKYAEKSNITEIFLIGDEVTKDRFKLGDKVLVNPIAGSSFEIDDVSYLMIREDDIIGVIEE